MSWSRAEILALATKAARGAGAPPGQATQFGQAAAQHLGRGRSADDLLRALAQLPSGPILQIPVEISRVMISAEGHQSIDASFEVGAYAALFESYLESLPCKAAITARKPETFHIMLEPNVPAPREPLDRITGCDLAIEKMAALAARTFVPESEASRLAGAGAGLTDND
ncbi:hypothetical protein [uncultured Roseobacter sp.]|uniref:hypothetical protein n=1 Tax=uncultured Roseobacter sp. TaxID=114847 RepID=UPI002619DA34|nr:hypothetical protein [uncultured Roseobacter sp.]